MKKYLFLLLTVLKVNMGLAETTPPVSTPQPLTVDRLANRLWDIPQELLFKEPSKDPIQNEAPPFFTFVPNANYSAANFKSTTLPSTQVNIAKYAKSPIKNESQLATEIPGLIGFATTSYGVVGISFNTQNRGDDVNHMLDGIPLNRIPGRTGDRGFSALPPAADIDRINFYNNGSTLFGAGGFSTINYVTRNPTKESVARFKTNHAFSSVGEYGTNSSVDGTIDSFGYYLTMNHNQSDGVRHNADFTDYYGSAKFVFDVNKDTLLTFGYLKRQSEAGQPGGLTLREYEIDRNMGPTPANRGSRIWNDRDTGYVKLNHQVSDSTQMELNGYGFIDLFTERSTNTSITNTLVTKRESSVIGMNGKLSHTWEIEGEKQLLNLGGNFASYKDTSNVAFTRDLSLNDTRALRESVIQTYEGGVFVENRFQWGKFSITPGARLDVVSFAGHDRYNLNRTRNFPQIDRTIVDVVPKLSLATSYEILNQTDLFFNIMQDHISYDPATTASQNNNTLILSENYSIERILKYEGGVRGKIRPWSDYSASLFVIDHDNFKNTFTRNGVSFVEDNTAYFTRGAEMQLRVVATHLWQDLIEQRSVYEPTQWGDLAFSGNILFMDAQQEGGINNDRQVVFSPDFVVKGGVYYNYQNRLLANLTGQWVERYYQSNNNLFTQDVPGYMVWDFNLEYWVVRDSFKLMMGIHNLFDEDYYALGNSSIDPAPERTYYVGLGFSL